MFINKFKVKFSMFINKFKAKISMFTKSFRYGVSGLDLGYINDSSEILYVVWKSRKTMVRLLNFGFYET